MPRLLRTPLVGGKTAAVGATLRGLGVTAGIVAILTGHSAGLEWLEFPWQCDVPLVIGGTMMGVSLLRTLRNRRVEPLYVSVWYIAAGLIWLPILIIVANWPGLHFGVQQAAMNWWYGHNVLGLWFTPIVLAAIYYLIPKVLGKPIHSYNLSLIGLWTLAFFYSQVGGHHLIGGPVPGWLISRSIVQSMMMIVPVTAVAINQHRTSWGYLGALRHSPTLRFVVLGGMRRAAARSTGPKLGEMSTRECSPSSAIAGIVASHAPRVPPVEVPITITESPSARPISNASTASSSQSRAVTPSSESPGRPCPVSRVSNRLAPSARATCSLSGAVS